MGDPPAPPILVTGSHRSGTTWVGRMLALDPEIVYINEPFNPVARRPTMRRRPPFWFYHVSVENESELVGPLDDLIHLRLSSASLTRRGSLRLARQRILCAVRGLPPPRPLLKDPIAVMSAEWLAERFGTQNVVMIRHPAAVAGSLKRLNWTFDFNQWLQQPLLMRDLLAQYEAEIRSYAEGGRDIIDQSILLWNAINHVILGYRERHADWTFVRVKDLAESPVERFHDMYDRLGLRWTDGVADKVWRSSSDERHREVTVDEVDVTSRYSRAARWTWLTRLTAEEQARVRIGTADVAASFFDDADWDPTNAPS